MPRRKTSSKNDVTPNKRRQKGATDTANILADLDNLLKLATEKPTTPPITLDNAIPYIPPANVVAAPQKNENVFSNLTVQLPSDEQLAQLIYNKNNPDSPPILLLNSSKILPANLMAAPSFALSTSLTPRSPFKLFNSQQQPNQATRNKTAVELFTTAIRNFLSDKTPSTTSFYMALILSHIGRFHWDIADGVEMRQAILFLHENSMLLLNTPDIFEIANAKKNGDLRYIIDMFNTELKDVRKFHSLIQSDGLPEDRETFKALKTLVNEPVIKERTIRNIELMKNKEQFFYIDNLANSYIRDLQNDYPKKCNRLLADALEFLAKSKLLPIFCKQLDNLTKEQIQAQGLELEHAAASIRFREPLLESNNSLKKK